MYYITRQVNNTISNSFCEAPNLTSFKKHTKINYTGITMIKIAFNEDGNDNLGVILTQLADDIATCVPYSYDNYIYCLCLSYCPLPISALTSIPIDNYLREENSNRKPIKNDFETDYENSRDFESQASDQPLTVCETLEDAVDEEFLGKYIAHNDIISYESIVFSKLTCRNVYEIRDCASKRTIVLEGTVLEELMCDPHDVAHKDIIHKNLVNEILLLKMLCYELNEKAPNEEKAYVNEFKFQEIITEFNENIPEEEIVDLDEFEFIEIIIEFNENIPEEEIADVINKIKVLEDSDDILKNLTEEEIENFINETLFLENTTELFESIPIEEIVDVINEIKHPDNTLESNKNIPKEEIAGEIELKKNTTGYPKHRTLEKLTVINEDIMLQMLAFDSVGDPPEGGENYNNDEEYVIDDGTNEEDLFSNDYDDVPDEQIPNGKKTSPNDQEACNKDKTISTDVQLTDMTDTYATLAILAIIVFLTVRMYFRKQKISRRRRRFRNETYHVRELIWPFPMSEVVYARTVRCRSSGATRAAVRRDLKRIFALLSRRCFVPVFGDLPPMPQQTETRRPEHHRRRPPSPGLRFRPGVN